MENPQEAPKSKALSPELLKAFEGSNAILWKLFFEFLKDQNGEKLIAGFTDYIKSKAEKEKRNDRHRLIVTLGITILIFIAGYLGILERNTVGTLAGGVIGFIARGYFGDK